MPDRVRLGDDPPRKEGVDAGADSITQRAQAWLGLHGIWRQAANFGVVGVIAGLLVSLILYTLPAAQRLSIEENRAVREQFREDLRSERELFREEQMEQRKHDESRAERLINRIDDNQRSIRELMQVVQANQHAIAELTAELTRLKARQPTRPKSGDGE